MTRAVRPLMAVLLLGLLAIPAPVLGARDAAPSDTSGDVAFDTPAPRKTPKPTPKPPDPTKTPKPTPAPEVAVTLPPMAALTAARDSISVGVPEGDMLSRVPLLVAAQAGYFEDAGLDDVSVVDASAVLPQMQAGELDFGVVDALDAVEANAADASLRMVAGYQNYDVPDGVYGGSVLMAAPGLVADEPSTVMAFTSAYIRALRDMADADAAEVVALAASGDLTLGGRTEAELIDALAAFAPFDGGFGAVDDDDGWGELGAFLADATGAGPDLQALVAQHTLNISQASLGLPANPVTDLAGLPGITEINIGMPASDLATSPVATAKDSGYFEDAGFADVEIMDIEEPLLGVLQGELDFAIIDQVDAADGAAQGLPLVAIAGHQNYSPDGAYGGDLLAVSSDLLDQEGATVSAFLIAYLQALRDLDDAGDATAFAPFDGGFGDRAQGGGRAELGAYLETQLGTGADLEALIDARPLEYAQAWWGLPANPTDAADEENQ